jgi:hypothetical protein
MQSTYENLRAPGARGAKSTCARILSLHSRPARIRSVGRLANRPPMGRLGKRTNLARAKMERRQEPCPIGSAAGNRCTACRPQQAQAPGTQTDRSAWRHGPARCRACGCAPNTCDLRQKGLDYPSRAEAVQAAEAPPASAADVEFPADARTQARRQAQPAAESALCH